MYLASYKERAMLIVTYSRKISFNISIELSIKKTDFGKMAFRIIKTKFINIAQSNSYKKKQKSKASKKGISYFQ